MLGCRPARVTEGKPHPDPIVETACLANVLPPVPTYRHHIGPCVAAGMLSDAQIETVIYANQRFELPPLADGARCSCLVAEMMGCSQCLHVALSSQCKSISLVFDGALAVHRGCLTLVSGA